VGDLEGLTGQSVAAPDRLCRASSLSHIARGHACIASDACVTQASSVASLAASRWCAVQDETVAQCRAYVERGVLHWYGRELSLPFLRGSGTFRIRYLGRNLRIFENPGSALAVQVREAVLLSRR
jgi:hypothetical protein